MENIILTIDPQQQRVLIQGSHLQVHEHPQYTWPGKSSAKNVIHNSKYINNYVIRN